METTHFKRGFPRSARTKNIERIFVLNIPRHLRRAAFAILEMFVLLFALSPPEEVNIGYFLLM